MEEILINQILQSYSSPLLNTFFQLVTYLGHPVFWIIIAALFYWSNKKDKALYLIGLIIISSLISGVLKILIAKPRPSGILILENQDTYSMPSGHSTLVASGSTYIFGVIHTIQKYWLIIIAIIVGISRIYLGAHYLSDVIVGLVLGLILGLVFLRLEKSITKIKQNIKLLNENIVIGILVVLVIISIIQIKGEYLIVLSFLTFFLGHFVNKKLKISETKQTKLILFIGAIILLIFLYLALTMTLIISQLSYIISGLFVTIIWPKIVQKLTKTSKKRKNKAK